MSAKLRVLITGAAGRIGRRLRPVFRERYELRTLDRQPVPEDANAIVADLQDLAALERALAGIEVLVHLAAIAKETDFHTQLLPHNIVGLYNTFEAARRAGVRRIVFASSVQASAHFPPGHTIRVTEPPRPVSIYGATKIFGEAIGRYYHDVHHLEFVGLRLGAFQANVPGKPSSFRDIQLTPADATRLFTCAVEKPGIGYVIAHGTSRTPVERLSLTEARELLGYEPEEDVL